MRIHHHTMTMDEIICFVRQYTKQIINVIPNVTKNHYNVIQFGKKSK